MAMEMATTMIMAMAMDIVRTKTMDQIIDKISLNIFYFLFHFI